MTLLSRPSRLLTRHTLIAALLLAACTPEAVKKAAPPIATLGDRKAPVEEILPIIKTDEIDISPELAAQNYQEILKLQADDDTKRESMRRLADLSVQIEDAKGESANSEEANKKAIKLYNDLLYSRPDDKANDRVFYQLARAYQNAGDMDAAIETLLKLTARHPDSEFTDDAFFRRAELLFARGRYDEAEPEYKKVMDLKDQTPFFEAAQYKFGWSRYKQSNYEGALEVFIAILDRELPTGQLLDPKQALAGVDSKKGDIAKDSLRVVSLSFAALGSGPAINEYLGKKGEPRFYPMLYVALADLLMEKRRYTDTANTFAAFITRYPKDVLAPDFQARVIGAYKEGGFNDLVVREKERYAVTYDPAAAYWGGQPARPEVLKELRVHFEDLGKHYFAKAQASGKLAPPPGRSTEEMVRYKEPADFLTASRWYQRILEVFPGDARQPEMNFMLGESLLYGGRTLEGAQQLMRTAYDYPLHPRTGDAAYGAVLAYQQHARDVPPVQRPEGLKLAIGASLKLAEKLPQHPEVYRVLTRSAEDLFELKDYEQVIAVAGRVIAAPVAADPQLQRTAWSLSADSQFTLKRYAEAEKAYTEELRLTPANAPSYADTAEQIAVCIFRQGEAARDSGDLRTAATQFLRVSRAVPTAKLRPTAEYEGATMLVRLQDWANAAIVLEDFRTQYPSHPLEADVDKKLAVAYQRDNKPLPAAQTYARIARRPAESPDTRREAAWLAATLFDTGRDQINAVPAYEFYLSNHPRPLQRALDARQRLADVARERGDMAARQRWLREIIAADETAGAERSAKTRAMGASAALEVARLSSESARRLALRLPLEKSLPRKKQAMETAIRELTQAANYGYAEIATAATYELGQLYQDFAVSLLESERPRNLQDLELEQYNALLEEQSFPFEEKAIETYETNLRRINQGLYDTWVANSAKALAQMAPAKYGKKEKGEDRYDSLR